MEKEFIIHKRFTQICQKYSDKVCLQTKKEEIYLRYTYKDTYNFSQKIGKFLLEEIGEDKPVAIILENSPLWVFIYLGIMFSGNFAVPIDCGLGLEEIENILTDSGAKILFTSQQILDSFKTQIKGTEKIIVLEKDLPKIESVSIPENFKFPKTKETDIASVLYTSGTTAHPKGVSLTHYNFCSNFYSIEKLNLIGEDDNFISILPFHHAYPFMVNMITPLFLGATVTFPESLKSEGLIKTLKETGVTIFVGVPQIFSLIHRGIYERIRSIPLFLRFLLKPLLKKKLKERFGKSLKFMASGGARLDPKVGRDLHRLGFNIIEGYGLSETSPVVTLNPPRRVKFGSVGKVLPDVEIKIDNPDSKGIGEVLIRGPNVMKGYFRREDLTSEVLKEGWFYSGDLGFIDKDGYLFLTGRRKELIILASGKNIYPEEIEEYYKQSPYIKELCVLETEGKLHAIILPDLDYFKKEREINIRGKIHWDLENFSKELPTYKRIMGFTVITEELPKTRLGKIRRYQVKAKYIEKKVPKEKIILSEEDRILLESDVAKKTIDFLSKHLKKRVNLYDHLELDLGVDSLSRVELALSLEKTLNISIPDESATSIFTVKELIQLILSQTKKDKILTHRKEQWSEVIREPPSQKVMRRIDLHLNPLNSFLTFIFKGVFSFIFRIFWALRVKGKENIPKESSYILCPNHASYLDGFIIFSSLPLRVDLNLYFLSYSRFFENIFLSWTVKPARIIPIDPAIYLTEALQTAALVLRNKKSLCIFPEGVRSIDRNLGEFKKGVGILAKELDIPLIPVYIKGSHQSWPRGYKLPRFCTLKVIFGRPLDWRHLLEKGRNLGISDDYEAIAKGLKEEVLKLSTI